MAHKFTLTIELGNDSMNTPRAVAHALKKAAKQLEECPTYLRLEGRVVLDVNGNKVGKWEYENK